MTEIRLAHAANGMAVTGHGLATQAAVEMLIHGGNAADAAICASMVLNVVEPYASSVGGDVFALIYDPGAGKVFGLNGSGCAPRSAVPTRFPEDIPRTGILTATIPGAVAGLFDLHARFGRRPWAELLVPAIAHARQGFAADKGLEDNARQRAATLAENPAAASLFLPGGKPIEAGARLVQPRLAETLTAIAEGGAGEFYSGSIAERIAREVPAMGGLIAASDLSAHASLWQTPIEAPFYGHRVATMPPNSYGLTLLLQLVALERAGIGRLAPDSADFVLAGTRARDRAYAAAGRVIGDPAALETPAKALLGRWIAGDESAPSEPGTARGGGTTNVIIWDKSGMVVSLVESISMPFGAGVVLEDTGILLNNRLRGFTTERGHPNCLSGRKRPAHTLTPCLALKDGLPSLALGTPGAAGQTPVLAQLLSRLLAHGQDLAAAIAAPRWSMDFQGAPIAEKAMDEATRQAIGQNIPALKTMPTGWQTFGSAMAARPAPDGGLEGAADFRRSASAAGC